MAGTGAAARSACRVGPLCPVKRGIGVGIGFSFVPISIAALAGVQLAEASLASSLINTLQQIGGALGIAALSTIASSRTNDVLAAGGTVPSALVDAPGWLASPLAAFGLANQERAYRPAPAAAWLSNVRSAVTWSRTVTTRWERLTARSPLETRPGSAPSCDSTDCEHVVGWHIQRWPTRTPATRSPKRSRWCPSPGTRKRASLRRRWTLAISATTLGSSRQPSMAF